MAARTAASTLPAPPAPASSGTMATSSESIPRLADTRPQQDAISTNGSGTEAAALPSTSNEAAALHIGKAGKGKG